MIPKDRIKSTFPLDEVVKITIFSVLQRVPVAPERDSPHSQGGNKYILLDVLLCSIAEYFYELCCILTSP